MFPSSQDQPGLGRRGDKFWEVTEGVVDLDFGCESETLSRTNGRPEGENIKSGNEWSRVGVTEK